MTSAKSQPKSQPKGPRTRPNLLFLFGDEHRADALGCVNPDVQSPVLDGLAAEGICFTNAIANTPVCTPMRGCLLTGQWPLRHGAVSNDLPVRAGPETPSIARSLAAQGYRRGYIGKWHLGGWPRDRFTPPGPQRLGFDDLWAAWECHHQYMRPTYHLNDDPTPVRRGEQYEPQVQTDIALDWLAEHLDRQGDAPFCLFVSYGPPHSPYRPLPPGTEGLYDPAALTLRPNCPESAAERRDLADYYAHVTGLDRQIGRLVDFLRARGALDDTLVVYSSDHGTMLGSQGHHHKQQPWEESANVPLVLRFGHRLPADVRGRRSDLLIGVLDYAPTLLGLLGARVPDAMQGRDLSRLILRPAEQPGAADRPTSVYMGEMVCCDQALAEQLLPWRAVRTARHTYARDLHGPWVLYDNQADPYQLTNLAQDPVAQPLREALEAELRGWMERFDDPLVPAAALLERTGLTPAWIEREAHFHPPGHPARHPTMQAVDST
ncbi:MAG: sulfatase [Chloroflexota bacterium]|nr:sulfatase [Chloroflexota bacterium]